MSLSLSLSLFLSLSLSLSLSIFFGHVLSSHLSEQMFQSSQVSRLALRRSPHDIFLLVVALAFVSVFLHSSRSCHVFSSP